MTSIHHSACIFTAYRRVNHSILLTSHQFQVCPESEINYLTNPFFFSPHRALDPVAFQHLPWIWNSWCRLHSWLQNCRLPFAMWIVGRWNRGPVAKRSLFSLWVKIATGKWKTLSHFLSATSAMRFQNTKCSSGDTYHSALRLQPQTKHKIAFFFTFSVGHREGLCWRGLVRGAHYARSHAFHNFLLSWPRSLIHQGHTDSHDSRPN